GDREGRRLGPDRQPGGVAALQARHRPPGAARAPRRPLRNDARQPAAIQKTRYFASTRPIFSTAILSRAASLARKSRNCGASRYMIGASALSIATLNAGSVTATRTASRNFAWIGAGVAAGANTPAQI